MLELRKHLAAATTMFPLSFEPDRAKTRQFVRRPQQGHGFAALAGFRTAAFSPMTCCALMRLQVLRWFSHRSQRGTVYFPFRFSEFRFGLGFAENPKVLFIVPIVCNKLHQRAQVVGILHCVQEYLKSFRALGGIVTGHIMLVIFGNV